MKNVTKLLLCCSFLCGPVAFGKTVTVNFESRSGLILLHVQLNGKDSRFLLDTGANNSIVDLHSAGLDSLKLDALRSTGSAGAEGGCAIRQVQLTIGQRSSSRRVCIMDLSDVSRRMGTHIDGFIGLDVLSEFGKVRINFDAHTLEFD